MESNFFDRTRERVLNYVFGEGRVKRQDYIGFVDNLYENLSWRVRKLILEGDVEKMDESVDRLSKRRGDLLGKAYRRLNKGYYEDKNGYERELELLVRRTGIRLEDLRRTIESKKKDEDEGFLIAV